MRNMHNGEWVQVFDLVPNKTISVKRYEKMKAVVDAAKHLKKSFEIAANYPNKDRIYYFHLKDDFARAEAILFEALTELDAES